MGFNMFKLDEKVTSFHSFKMAHVFILAFILLDFECSIWLIFAVMELYHHQFKFSDPLHFI